MIEICDVNFGYSDEDIIIKKFSASIKKGQIISIVGSSGCGKSTLLNLIAGLLKPTNGEVILNEKFSYLTQTPTLLSYKNAFENSVLACELRNTLNAAKLNEASVLFQNFNLEGNAKNKFPNELSGGMRQRVGLIQTLLVDASLYLFDEPFNAIDKDTSFKILKFLWEKIKKEQSGAIIVTHDLEQSVLISDQIIVMPQDRRLKFENDFIRMTPEERFTSDQFNQYMLKLIRTSKM